ncbi:hypothetical protein [Streptomyces sp. NPDC096132]|uniref:hypothetical protein n=1 Tax=Streptomyces sp. NPDC096132 TaxID=3366075 RepID=UPI00381A33A3
MPFNTAEHERFSRPVAVVASVVSVVIALVLITAAAGDALLGFADFWCGVIALLSFTGAVVWGQISIDRRVLTPRHRLWAQAVHRAVGVLGLGSLALHVVAKIACGQASPAAVVPFAESRGRFLVGLGALALYLMLAAAVTGAARSVFVERQHPRRWRWLHGAAYLGWGSALVHGLKAGRPVSTPWVTVGYGACLLAVVAVLVWRAVRPASAGLRPATTPLLGPGRGHRRAGRAGGNRRAGRGREMVPASARLEPLPVPPPRPQPAAGQGAEPEPIALPFSPPLRSPHPQPGALGRIPSPRPAQDFLQTWPGTPVDRPHPPQSATPAPTPPGPAQDFLQTWPGTPLHQPSSVTPAHMPQPVQQPQLPNPVAPVHMPHPDPSQDLQARPGTPVGRPHDTWHSALPQDTTEMPTPFTGGRR